MSESEFPTGLATTVTIVGLLGLLIPVSLLHNINWDEFYFLSHVHAWLDDRLDRPLQTFFVHGFGWLQYVPGHEVNEIIVARLSMIALLVLTCVAIWRIGARLTDDLSGRIAVLAFLSSGFVIPHGASFRADPIATCLLMTALATLVTGRMTPAQISLVSVSCALALLVTVKSVLYLSAFLGVLLWQRHDRRLLLRSGLAGVLAVVFAAGLYLWHVSGIDVADGKDTATNLRGAGGTTLLSGMLFPRASEISLWAILSLPALALAGSGLRRAGDSRCTVLVLAFAVPLVCLVIYRNAFPYFFPFITAPLMLAVAVGASRLRGHARFPLFIAAMAAIGVGQGVQSLRETNTAQRATLDEVHRLFPEPVPYIDQHAMVSTFPQHGFFMSTWGLQSYREAGKPVFPEIVAAAQPPLLLASRETLTQALRTGAGALLADDRAVLKDSYVHYAGAIWLAGRDLRGDTAPTSFRMPFAGRYRLEAPGPVRIDGVEVLPGTVISLDGLAHVLEAPVGMELRLIWSTAVDATAPPDLPEDGLYSRFWRL